LDGDKKMITGNEIKSRVFGIGFMNPSIRFQKKYVEDIPVMISGNYLVCIPKTDEVRHWGVIGISGSCKSLFLNAQLSFRYWFQDRTCILLNDFQRETFDWNLECRNDEFIKVFNLIGLNPCSTPMVYVFPSTSTLIIDSKEEKFPITKMTIPIDYVVKNIEQFHTLDKSKLYLGNIKEELSECTSMQEIKEVLEENFPDKEQKLMKFKMLSVFEDLFQNKVLNVSSPESPAFLEYRRGDEKYLNTIIQTLMRAGLVPSIQTSDLSNQEFLSPYMSFIVKTIYENQSYDKYFKKVTINLFVDEIDKLWLNKENGKIIKKYIGLIGTNGRMSRIEIGWATQDSNYEQVPKQIIGNTKYLTVAKLSDPKYISELKKEFFIPKELAEDMLRLKSEPEKGLFEVIFLAKEKYVLYDLTNGNKTESNEPRKGFIIPPVAGHRVPYKK
jgi:hypothetical protein